MVKSEHKHMHGAKSETRKPELVGLFGGSFDPPHLGHQALVHAALALLNLDAVRVIPAGVPVHRQLSGQAMPAQRFDWLLQMFAGDKRVAVVDWETARTTPTPSIATLRRFVHQNPQARPVFLLGADACAGMDHWVDYPAHADVCDIAVFARAGCELPTVAKAFRPVSLSEWRQQIGSNARMGWRVDVPCALPDVSATSIRQRVQAGKNLAGMVADCIRPEIEQAYA
ncbi:MAG: adenylyltransferase/cytidyltransferase family protein [Mariprofundaceae bacterium]